jgi:hypothetical protein
VPDLRRAFGIPSNASVQSSETVAVSTLECDVLQMATEILQGELQTPGVQQAQDLIQHVLDNADDGMSDPSAPMPGY